LECHPLADVKRFRALAQSVLTLTDTGSEVVRKSLIVSLNCLAWLKAVARAVEQSGVIQLFARTICTQNAQVKTPSSIATSVTERVNYTQYTQKFQSRNHI